MTKEHKGILRRLFKVAAHKYDSYSVEEKVDVVRDLFPEYRETEQESLEDIVTEVISEYN
jgi:hypothetical protein